MEGMTGTTTTTLAPIRIDFAVVNNQVDTQLVVQDFAQQYVTELDPIEIPESILKLIFFNSNAFYVNPFANTDASLMPYISFKNRTSSGKVFCLLDEILANYCKDAGVPETSFTPCSLIGLNKQISAIATLYNVYQNRTGICSLNWDEIVHTVMCDLNHDTMPTYADVHLVFTASFIPKASNTINFLPSIIKFIFKTTVTL